MPSRVPGVEYGDDGSVDVWRDVGRVVAAAATLKWQLCSTLMQLAGVPWAVVRGERDST